MRRDARTDSNQQEIVSVLRKIGASVAITSGVGHGFPDLVVGLAGRTYLLEVKTATGKLTPDEHEFITNWLGDVAIVRSPEEAIEYVLSRAAATA